MKIRSRIRAGERRESEPLQSGASSASQLLQSCSLRIRSRIRAWRGEKMNNRFYCPAQKVSFYTAVQSESEVESESKSDSDSDAPTLQAQGRDGEQSQYLKRKGFRCRCQKRRLTARTPGCLQRRIARDQDQRRREEIGG